MRFIKRSNAFKRSYSLMEKRGKEMEKLHKAIVFLAQDAPLPLAYRDHALTGHFSGFRDLHIEPDWLLIYSKQNATTDYPEGILYLELTGTHSDLF